MQDNKLSRNLSVIKDYYTTDHDALFSSYALSKYNLCFEELKIKFEDVEEVIKKIQEFDKTIVRSDFAISVFYDFYVLESETSLITFDSYDNKKKVQINYYFKGDYESSKEIFEIIQSFQDLDDELFVSISSFFFDSQKSIKVTESIKVKKDFEYNSLEYYPYLDVPEMFKQYLMSESNILLLAGTPGTGKSKLGDAFMKHLLESVQISSVDKIKTEIEVFENSVLERETVVNDSEGIKVAYIKNEDILSEDLFWNILKEDEYHLVFLDDLDFALLPRTQNISTSEDISKNKFISNLLSFTDGIFDNTTVNTKFIITTNRTIGDIDTAVLRKGRTFDILELRQLNHEEGAEIWTSAGLDLDEYNDEFTVGSADKVLQADLGSSINMKLKSKEQNIALSPYIKEDGISLYSKMTHPKKIGL